MYVCAFVQMCMCVHECACFDACVCVYMCMCVHARLHEMRACVHVCARSHVFLSVSARVLLLSVVYTSLILFLSAFLFLPIPLCLSLALSSRYINSLVSSTPLSISCL